MEIRSLRWLAASADAVLQAMTIALTFFESMKAASSRAYL
jgi:hypothetical protein